MSQRRPSQGAPRPGNSRGRRIAQGFDERQFEGGRSYAPPVSARNPTNGSRPSPRPRHAHTLPARALRPGIPGGAGPHTLLRGDDRASAPRGSVCNEQQARHGADRIPKPVPKSKTANRKCRVVRGGKLRVTATGRRRRSDDEHASNAAALPALFGCELRRKPGLAIEPVERRLAVRDDRFDLDHEEDPGLTVIGQDVD